MADNYPRYWFRCIFLAIYHFFTPPKPYLTIDLHILVLNILNLFRKCFYKDPLLFELGLKPVQCHNNK